MQERDLAIPNDTSRGINGTMPGPTDMLRSTSVAFLNSRRLLPWTALGGERMRPIKDRPPYLSSHSFYHPYFSWKEHPQVQLFVFTVYDATLYVGGGDSGMVLLSSGHCIREQSLFSKSYLKGVHPRPTRDPISLETILIAFDARWFNYYHLLCGILPRLKAAQCAVPDNVPIGLPSYCVDENDSKSFSEETYKRVVSFAAPSHRITYLDSGTYKIRKLLFLATLPERYGFSDEHIGHLAASHTPLGVPNIASAFTDIAELRPFYGIFDELRTAVTKKGGSRKNRRLYLDRGHATDPRIPSPMLPGLLAYLSRNGYERIVLDDLQFDQQVCTIAEADIIISPHGAGLTNLLFSDPGTLVVEIIQRFPNELVYRPYFYQLASGRKQPYLAFDITEQRFGLGALLDIAPLR